MDNKIIITIVLLLLAIFGFLIYLRGQTTKNPTENEPAPPPTPPIPIPLPVPVPVPPVEPVPVPPVEPVPPPVPPVPPTPPTPPPPPPPPPIDNTERMDTTTQLLLQTKDANGVLAVPNLEMPQKGINFRQIITGTAIPVAEQTDIYPLVIQKSDLNSLILDFNSKLDSNRRVIKSIGDYKFYENTGPPVFYNISHVEVLPLYPAYKKYHYDDFIGNWFDLAVGTGFFMPVSITFMAYNAVHMLKLIGIGVDKIFSYASSVFQKQVGNAAAISKILDMTYQEYVDGKYNYINNETRPMKYLTWMALQKGYKTIQLAYEFDGTFVRRYFIDCLDPNISNRKLVRRNPFSLLPNPASRHWYYNMYLVGVPTGITVDEKFIKDVGSNRSFYEILPFQRECRLAGGIINIYNKYLQCLKIVKFGLAPEILMTESPVDFSKYPKTTELEKLQSYYSIVYGDDPRWKTQTLEQLRWRWDAGEIVYNALVTGLGITTPFATKRARTQVYHQSFGSTNSTVTANNTIICKRINYKNSEQLKYIEVFRQGTRSSTVEDNPNFAGTYYYSIRGSGYFLPTGQMFYSKRKNNFFASVGLPDLPEPAWEQDKPLSSACISKGVDVFNVSNFVNINNEVIHNVDIITSLSSLIRMSPFDERVTQVNDNVFSDPYINYTPTGESVKRQFDYTIDYQYP